MRYAPDPPARATDVAARVREVIARAGCSQREFARRIVMDPSKLSRSLGGSRRFTAAELARVADVGDVDAGWLLGTDAGTGTGTDAGAGTSAGATPRTGSARAAGAAPAPAPVAVPTGGRPLQIVRETVRLIAEQGFHAVRVADIAAACGTSSAAVHYHFPGRAELLEAAIRWCMDEDTAARAACVAAEEDAHKELRQLIALQTPYTEQRRRQWRVWLDLWAEAARSTATGRLHVDYYRQWRTTVADVIRRGVAQGVFRPETDPESAALRLTALIDGLASQVLATEAYGADPETGTGSGTDPGGTGPEQMEAALLAHVETELTPHD
ncbi:TetR family transcriptional regulator C-terminal domain-containing protein [Streptomyces phytohabitans]|uniref:TetR family transcriptional regulator C-terminal domain-containing protein n=1 Tax=Streptomyces phytohabitans TaxID=1150371 RepID=UPI00345BFC26